MIREDSTLAITLWKALPGEHSNRTIVRLDRRPCIPWEREGEMGNRSVSLTTSARKAWNRIQRITENKY